MNSTTDRPVPHGWDENDTLQARREGWDLFDVNHTGRLEIQAYDESFIFDDDRTALGHVYAMAAQGSELHKRALALCLPDRLEQQALVAEEKSYKPFCVRHDGLKVETRVERLHIMNDNGVPLPEDAIAAGYNVLVGGMAAENFKLVNSWSSASGATVVMVFERTSKPTGGYNFSLNVLVATMRELASKDARSIGQRIQLKYLPEGWSDRLPSIANELARGGPSAHIIPVEEMALMLVRVFLLGQGGPMRGL
jgi:hypothetical protein